MATLPLHRSGQHWLIKYRLYHIPFWFSYHYLLWTITIGNPIKAANTMFNSPYTVKFLFYLVFQAAAVYFNLYFLIPRYLKRGRFTAYMIYLILTVVCASLLVITGYFAGALAAGKTLQEMYGVEGNCFYTFFGNAFPSTIAIMTLAMSIKLTKNWMQTEGNRQLLEKEKLETELKFLKYQINPHFLFNSINSIFFLIHKNPDMASASLAKFSDLLRYQLYECNDLQIPLAKEITYLENFIELERLRQNKNVAIHLQLDPPNTGHLGIAPFILMTFVENAFKHVSKDADADNWIDIRLSLDHRQLDFAVSNSMSRNPSHDLISYGGIGLKNVRRRLDLIYPNHYVLDIAEDQSRFDIRLRLDLSVLTIPQAMLPALQTA